MNSIITDKRECYICHSTNQLQSHHIFTGCNRKASEKYGLKVYLCMHHHTGNDGVHNGNELWYKKLQVVAQSKFEETHTRDEFMQVFHKNYL